MQIGGDGMRWFGMNFTFPGAECNPTTSPLARMAASPCRNKDAAFGERPKLHRSTVPLRNKPETKLLPRAANSQQHVTMDD
jgi:hypothetical protein